MIVEVVVRKTLMNKNIDKSYTFIEDLEKNHYQWGNDRSTTK